ncbi:hypothetical protein F5B22DRAFT_603020 [Xylaria bambusicola]|uniref:uncharacterized protein n=1 Tax=Xylaria bambusicola TaxID=326684 RepID=UPI0020071FD4|nr:uncharacterized protein F5B22DRAFT_603020 [Xylaria bambusicola]KAI0517453.1 hypothetical protein F5B22DRAFT_603020 [Xylaria bambusicola]
MCLTLLPQLLCFLTSADDAFHFTVSLLSVHHMVSNVLSFDNSFNRTIFHVVAAVYLGNLSNSASRVTSDS